LMNVPANNIHAARGIARMLVQNSTTAYVS
jgi:hypothetical protein